MPKSKYLLLCFLSIFTITSAFAIPVPEDKYEYIGEWIGDRMQLTIQKSGQISYKKERNSDGISANITIELKNFNSEGFDAGVGMIRTTFVVSRTPYIDGTKMKMIVDGVELTKTK